MSSKPRPGSREAGADAVLASLLERLARSIVLAHEKAIDLIDGDDNRLSELLLSGEATTEDIDWLVALHNEYALKRKETLGVLTSMIKGMASDRTKPYLDHFEVQASMHDLQIATDEAKLLADITKASVIALSTFPRDAEPDAWHQGAKRLTNLRSIIDLLMPHDNTEIAEFFSRLDHMDAATMNLELACGELGLEAPAPAPPAPETKVGWQPHGGFPENLNDLSPCARLSWSYGNTHGWCVVHPNATVYDAVGKQTDVLRSEWPMDRYAGPFRVLLRWATRYGALLEITDGAIIFSSTTPRELQGLRKLYVFASQVVEADREYRGQVVKAARDTFMWREAKDAMDLSDLRVAAVPKNTEMQVMGYLGHGVSRVYTDNPEMYGFAWIITDHWMPARQFESPFGTIVVPPDSLVYASPDDAHYDAVARDILGTDTPRIITGARAKEVCVDSTLTPYGYAILSVSAPRAYACSWADVFQVEVPRGSITNTKGEPVSFGYIKLNCLNSDSHTWLKTPIEAFVAGPISGELHGAAMPFFNKSGVYQGHFHSGQTVFLIGENQDVGDVNGLVPVYPTGSEPDDVYYVPYSILCLVAKT